MDYKALRGSLFILFSLIGGLIVLNIIDQRFTQNLIVLFAFILLIGFISGYIFGETVKKSILYLIVLGETLVGLLFIAFTSTFTEALNTSEGLDGLGLIFVGIVFLAIIIGSFLGFAVIGIILYISGMFGYRLAKDEKSK